MRLYDIANNYQRLMQSIIDSDELLPEQINEIESVDDSLEQKAEAIGIIIKTMEANQKAINERIQSMEERSSKFTNKIEALKEYLKSNLEKCGKKEIFSPWFDIKIKMNPVSVVITDDQLIPMEFINIQEIKKIDKLAIKAAMSHGIDIPGASLCQMSRVEIK